MADWSELPSDILLTISTKLRDGPVVDSINFSRVCRRWGVISQYYLNTFVPCGAPCLMVSGTNLIRDTISQSRCILSSPTPIVKNISLILDDLPRVMVPHLDLCRGSHQGWLVLIKNNMDMYMLNPFSNRRIDLPSLRTLKTHSPNTLMSKWYVNKAFLSSSPSNKYSSCHVLIVCDRFTELAFYKLEDARNFYEVSCKGICDAIYFRDRWHVLLRSGELYTYGLNYYVETIRQTDFLHTMLSTYDYSLVEWRDELLLIRQFTEQISDYDDSYHDPECCEEKHLHAERDFRSSIRLSSVSDELWIDEFDYDNLLGYGMCSRDIMHETYSFSIYKLDTSKETESNWIEVDNLKGGALFVGLAQSFFLPDSRLFGYEENHIYFTDSYIGSHQIGCTPGNDVGTYSLEESSVGLLYKKSIGSMRPPAIWVIPKL